MQVNALTSAYAGSQRHAQPDWSGKAPAKKSFEDFLFPSGTPEASEAEIDAALDRALMRMEPLVGRDVAESVVNEDGSINITRFTQVMNAATAPYGAMPRSFYAATPQVVDMIA